MNRVASVLLDRYGIMMKNRLRSPVSQFVGVPDRVPADWKVDVWDERREPPAIAFVEEHVGETVETRFHFESRCQENGEANKACVGLYVQGTPGSQVDVIVVHGWKSSSLGSVRKMFQEPMAAAGYNQFFIELPHHLHRKMPESGFSGEYMISADIARTIRSIQQAVQDVVDLVAWSRAQGHRTVVIGTSLGGLVTNLFGSTGAPVDALISIMYATNTAYLVWNSAIAKFIKKDLVAAGVTYPQLERAWDAINPLRYSLHVPKEKVLLISGSHDVFISADDSQKLWDGWAKPKRIVMPCGHGGMNVCPDQIAGEVLAFLRGVL